jgi:hydrogenase expression/formation protein HypC
MKKGIAMQVQQRCDDNFAVCRRGTQRVIVDMSLVGEQPKGTWVSVFLGAAQQVIKMDEVKRTNPESVD